MAARSGIGNHPRREDDFQPFAHPQRGCVLVVDDDPDVREVMEAILVDAGYAVETASNGDEALKRLRSIRPALIFLDVNMPVMDGAEFRQAQRRNRDLINIPTVVITAAAAEPLLDLAVQEVLRKPVRKADLLAIVERHCLPARE